ncbi:uncharacterized protein [Haliotis asinina]|uniref:uncharacterized protein n=1 Tax=Haliotis asinina TaxID=109174 RepID=UPI00353208E3
MCPLLFIVSLLECLYLLHGLNHSACYNSEFIIDSPLCESSGYLAPRKFLFGQISPSSTCPTELRGQRDYHTVRRCCKVHNEDTILKEVCIPGQKALLSSPLSQMARYCSRGNRCDSGKRLTSTELFTGDYVSLEFDCVPVKDEIHVNSDEVLYGKNVYLISDKKDGSVRDAKCVAYSNNPSSSIVIALVDNNVLSGTCTISFANSMSGTTTINCAKTEIVNGCNNVLYTATRSRVDINLTMSVLANNSDRQFLWMMASVTDGGNVTVACGNKTPPNGAPSTGSTKNNLLTQKGSSSYHSNAPTITPFRLTKTTKQTSHSETVSASNGPVPTLSPPTSNSGRPKSTAFMSLSPQPTGRSPSSPTSTMRTVPTSNVTSPQTNRTTSHQSSGPVLATSKTTPFKSYTATGKPYSSRNSRPTTVSITPTPTWLTTSKLMQGSHRSTQSQWSSTNSMPDSSSGLLFTTSSSPLLTTSGRIQTSTKTSLPSTKASSSFPQTYPPSPSKTATSSSSPTDWTTGGLHPARHTSYSTRPTQRLSSFLTETSSSSGVTPFHLTKTTKQTSHSETVRHTIPSHKDNKTNFTFRDSVSLEWSCTDTLTTDIKQRKTQIYSLHVTLPTSYRKFSFITNIYDADSSNFKHIIVFRRHTIPSHKDNKTNFTFRDSVSLEWSCTDTLTTDIKQRKIQIYSLHVTLPTSYRKFSFITNIYDADSSNFKHIIVFRRHTIPSHKDNKTNFTFRDSVSLEWSCTDTLTTDIKQRKIQVYSLHVTLPTSCRTFSFITNIYDADSSNFKRVTPFHLTKTTKQTSHSETVSASNGPVPTLSPPTSNSGRSKSTAFMSLSPHPTGSSPSSPTSTMRTVPTSNVTSPQTNRTTSHQSSGPVLATSKTTSFKSYTATLKTYSSRNSRPTTVSLTPTPTWLTTSNLMQGSQRSTQTQRSSTNSMPDSSSGLLFTTSSSPLLTTSGRIQTSTKTSLPSTKAPSSFPQTYPSSPSKTATSSSSLTHWTTEGLHPARHTPNSTRATYLTTVSRKVPDEKSTWNTGKSDNNDDKIAFIFEVITSLTGATLLILMAITTAMCLCFKKRMMELKRNSRHLKKLSETGASNMELKRRSVVSLESGYCSNSVSP